MRLSRTFLAALATAVVAAAAPAAADANGVLEGHVTDARGTPLARICVSVATSSTAQPTLVYTNTSGAWSASVAAGRYQIEFSGCEQGTNYVTQDYPNRPVLAGEPPGMVAVADGQVVTQIDATMQAGATLQGSLRDADTGQALAGPAPLIQLQTPGRDAKLVDDTSPDAHGSFSMTQLPAGTYVVEFQTSGLDTLWYPDAPDPSRAQPIQLSAGTTTRLATAEEGLGGTVTGIVRDWHGRAVADDMVQARAVALDGPNLPVRWGVTDETGHFVLPVLTPGTYNIVPVAVPHGNLRATGHATVSEGSTATADVTFGRARQLTRLRALRITRHRRMLRLTGRISDPNRVRGRVTLAFGPLAHRRTVRLATLRAAHRHFTARARLPKRYRRLPRPLIWIHVDGDRLYLPGTFCRSLRRPARPSASCQRGRDAGAAAR